MLELAQRLSEQENSLAIMLARDVRYSSIARSGNIMALNIVKFSQDLPSKLLEQRPDIMAAEQMLEAAKYQVKVVRASYFPEISLNSLLGVSSNQMNKLFDSKSRMRVNGANISSPIFDFGKTTANVEDAEAVGKGYLIEYEHSIRMAFAEALTNLAAQKHACAAFSQNKQSEAAVEKATKIINKQFKAGSIDYITMIAAQKNLIAAKAKMIDVAQLRLNATVDVFKAFGGDMQ
jgi:multidrug efflux system outer membrane protein